MSKAALSFLVLTLMALSADQLLSPSMEPLGTVARTCAGMSASLFIIAMIVGRRIKFDPVLRQAKP